MAVLVRVLPNVFWNVWLGCWNISTSGTLIGLELLLPCVYFYRLTSSYCLGCRAFIYVGLYGYSYLEAGKNVFTLFQNRGWEAIIADDLVNNVLLLVSVVVGGVIGALAIAIEATSDLFEDAGGNSKAVAFVLGFVIGLVVCSVALSTIGSGVNAVVVLFAEAPAEFQQNHPQLSERMRSAWSRVYPGSV